MPIDYFANDDDGSDKSTDLCSKVCAEFGHDAAKCNTVDPYGAASYKLEFKMKDNRPLNLYFKSKLSNLQGISDKMIVWAYVAPVAGIPIERKEEFLIRLLAINIESDTCAIGVNKNNMIMVKAERMLSGLDLKELKDMIKSTFSVTQKLLLDECPLFKVQTGI